MQADLVVIDARALSLWPAHDPITPVPSPRIKVSCRDEDGVDPTTT
jgi:cytosine/adenosine deaminase-related metal-dependent hydrolase